jgi:hypothetical protein
MPSNLRAHIHAHGFDGYDPDEHGPLWPERTEMMETCGYCSGTGRVPGQKWDRDGRHRPDWPDLVTCGYCNGAGQCKDGGKLLAARKPYREDTDA